MRAQLDKAARRALLDKIAAQRKNGTRHELEDSDSDGSDAEGSFITARSARPAVVLESSDEGSGGEERRPAPRRAAGAGAAPGAHRRLLKAADVPLPGAPSSQHPAEEPQRRPASQLDGGDEDIAAALEQLTIRKPPKPSGRSAGGGAGAGAGGSRRPAVGGARSRSSPPPEEEEAPAAGQAADESKCLVLGDKSEFKLK